VTDSSGNHGSATVTASVIVRAPFCAASFEFTPLWIVRHSGGLGGYSRMATDTRGNVFVLAYQGTFGSHSGRILLTKYDEFGHTRWEREVESAGYSAFDITSDANGNVYVATSPRPLYITPINIRKLDTNGALVWSTAFAIPLGGNHLITEIVVDENSDVFLAGATGGGTTLNYDFITLKLNSSGGQEWLARYTGPFVGGFGDVPRRLVVRDGFSYVTGGSVTESEGFDIATVKYGPAGDFIWARRYEGVGHEVADGITVDANGNVFITGGSEGPGTDYDVLTIRYNPDGSTAWEHRHNGPANGPDGGQDIALDSTGNAYVAGFRTNGFTSGIPNPDIALFKYDTTGRLVWSSTFGSPYLDNGRRVFVRSDNKILVVGVSADSTGSVLIEHSSDGTRTWDARYKGFAVHSHDALVDKADYLYQTAEVLGHGAVVTMRTELPALVGTPGAPTVTGDGNRVSLSWSPPVLGDRPTGYNLIVRSIEGGPLLALIPAGNVLSFSATAPNGSFVVSVQASNRWWGGPESAAVSFSVPLKPSPPEAPSNLSVVVSGATAAFTWSPPGGPNAPTRYLLSAAAASGGPSIAAIEVGAPASAVQIPRIPAGTYFVKIAAINGGGSSPFSNEVMVRIAAPAAPILHAALVNGTTVTLSWTPGPGPSADSFVVIAALAPSAPVVARLAVFGHSVSIPQVPSGRYFVRVFAVSTVGTGPLSNEISVIVP
jgi:hypothetical protein